MSQRKIIDIFKPSQPAKKAKLVDSVAATEAATEAGPSEVCNFAIYGLTNINL
jgi:hypothetical protein